MKLTVIHAFDLPDAWRQCLREVLQQGYDWTIQRGSFEGHQRKEFDNICITISNPGTRPLIPETPEGIPPPTDMNYVNNYLHYLITGHKTIDEQYTYGERIESQLDTIIDMLRKTPRTNQACIEVAQPADITLSDPPCLRLIDCRIRYGRLHFFVYFRSWDLWGAFPPNLAALQLVKEYMAAQIGVEDGVFNAWSKGLHLYDYQWKLAQELVTPRGRIRAYSPETRN